MPTPTAQEKDEEIIRELEHFNATGEVKTVPLIGFDQNGRWIGMKQFSTQENFPEKLTKKVRKLKVPLDVLISTDNDGNRRLRGSYVIDTETPVTIDLIIIEGNLIVRSETMPDFHAPNLTDVFGKLEIMAKNVDMPNLICAYDFMVLTETVTLNIPKLEFALRCVICPEVKEFAAPALQIVEGDFVVPSATSVHVPRLIQTKRHFLAGNATTIDAPNLKGVGGTLDTRSARDFYVTGLKGGQWAPHPEAQRRFAKKTIRGTPVEL